MARGLQRGEGAVRRLAAGTSLRDHLTGHPGRVKECASRIRVLRVNRKTLSLFAATDLDHLVGNLDRVFRDDMLVTHIDELCQLWDGRTEFAIADLAMLEAKRDHYMRQDRNRLQRLAAS